MIVESSRGPAVCEQSQEPRGLQRASSASDRSVDYSRSRCSGRSLPSHCDYSEDFVSECSEPARTRNYSKAEGKCEKEKKNLAAKPAPSKGQRGLPLGRQLEWGVPFLSTQLSMLTQRRDAVTHRVLSARLHKIKELRNELADVTRKLEATVVENQLLKQVQFRHLKAIGKYENSQSNLPQIVVKHQNEVRNLRQLLKRSQAREREAARKLRETDQELLKAKDALQSLQQLSEDKNLAEREELAQKLSMHIAKLEANDRKIQRLEKQLRLNNKSFSQQLATESQKTTAAQMTNKTLQAEMKRLQQKLKEKERELEIRNIYTNRVLKSLSEPQDDLRVSSAKATQVDRKAFSFVLTRHQETQKSYDLLALAAKVRRKAGSTAPKERTSACTCPSPPRSSKGPGQEEPKRKHHDPARELEPAEAQTRAPLGSAGRRGEKDEPAKGAAAAPAKPEAAPRGGVQAAASAERPERKRLAPPEPAPEPPAAPPASRPALRPRKHYAFTEVIENLHHGLPAAGPGPGHGPSRARARPDPDAPRGAYEPSFGRACQAPAQERAFREKKSSLMEELFGGPCALKDAPPGQASANNAFGDSRVTVPNSVPSPSPPDGKRKIII